MTREGEQLRLNPLSLGPHSCLKLQNSFCNPWFGELLFNYVLLYFIFYQASDQWRHTQLWASGVVLVLPSDFLPELGSQLQLLCLVCCFFLNSFQLLPSCPLPPFSRAMRVLNQRFQMHKITLVIEQGTVFKKNKTKKQNSKHDTVSAKTLFQFSCLCTTNFYFPGGWKMS